MNPEQTQFNTDDYRTPLRRTPRPVPSTRPRSVDYCALPDSDRRAVDIWLLSRGDTSKLSTIAQRFISVHHA